MEERGTNLRPPALQMYHVGPPPSGCDTLHTGTNDWLHAWHQTDIQRLKVMCFSKFPLADNKELFEAIDARQQSIDILQLHGNVRVLTLPHEHIPAQLSELCDSSVTKLYSKHGRLQHIDVFVHIYVARLLLLINDTRKQYNTRPP